MIWVKPIHNLKNTESRLLMPGKFPPGIGAHLPSAKRLAEDDKDRNTLFETPTVESQARCIKGWAPYVDTAFCISAFHISSFTVLDDWIDFFERPIRKIIRTADLLLVVSIARARHDDIIFLTDLLESRAANGLPTMMDRVAERKGWEEIYEHCIEV